MKPNDKASTNQVPEKETKTDKSKVVVPKGKHSFECGGYKLKIDNVYFSHFIRNNLCC